MAVTDERALGRDDRGLAPRLPGGRLGFELLNFVCHLVPRAWLRPFLPYDANVLRDTFKPVRARIHDYSPIFYEHFWRDYPETAPLFGKNMSRTELDTRINHFMLFITENADNPRAFLDYIRELARRHKKYNIRMPHFEHVSETNIKTLKDFLGDAFTPEAQREWRKGFLFLDRLMNACEKFRD